MTRCLNCGAERGADACEACGLTPSAAEFALRRRLLNRTAIFLVGVLAFLVSSRWYPPLELDAILIFLGVMFIITLLLAIALERRAVRHAEVEALKRAYFGLVPLPWLLGLLLMFNGAMDRTPPQNCVASVVGKFALTAPLPNRRLVVTSWREGRRVERVAVDRDDFTRFHPGDAIIVQVKSGLVGIPWVYGVTRR
jgi:hypothetical protein